MKEHKNILALRQLRPRSSFAWKNPDSYVTLKYRSDDVAPTESEIREQAKTSEMIDAMSFLRSARNVLLSRSDWTGLADSALTNEQAAEWKLYRQKLRDLPDGLTTEFKVKNVKWPTKP